MTLLAVATWRWSRDGKIRRQRGTAYVIHEEAEKWRPEDKAAMLAATGSGFANKMLVPGPRELGFDWHWRADEVTAPQWDRRAEEAGELLHRGASQRRTRYS